MENTIVYLVGPPGVGKLTVGRILAEHMPARLVDNHYWNDVIFPLAGADGTTPIPPTARERVDQVRAAVLDTIANLSPRAWNFIFTHGPTHANDHPYNRMITNQILWAAVRREARFQAVRLWCEEAELARRIGQPDRQLSAKLRDPALAAGFAAAPLYDPGHPSLIDIDTSGLTAEATAREILLLLQA